MKAKEIIDFIGGKIIGDKHQDLDFEVTNFKIDSRKIEKDDVYITVVSDESLEVKYSLKASENGAKMCIISNYIPGKEVEDLSKNTILVYVNENELRNTMVKEYKDLIEKLPENENKYEEPNKIKIENYEKALNEEEHGALILERIAKLKRLKNKDISVVRNNTEVYGKTSTKDIIGSVLEKKFKVCKTEGNLNNQIGMPLTILKSKDTDNILVTEMGIGNIGEMCNLTDIAMPNTVVFTNVGTAHIGNFGSRENILKAKMEILDGTRDTKIFLNNDNDMLKKWKQENKKYDITTFGIEDKESDYVAENIKLYEDKTFYDLKVKNEDKNIKVEVPIPGEHFVINSLAAIAVGRYYGISYESILDGIKNFKLTKKRMEIIKSKSGISIINDTYNANYDSMTAAIKYLETIKDKRKIAILGDMLELGEYSKKLHEDVGRQIRNIDILITIGNEAKNIEKYAIAKEKYHFDNNEDAFEKIKNMTNKNDIILLKASNGMKFEEIVNKLKEI